MKRLLAFTIMMFAAATAEADGLGINVPLVARITGAGNTQYVTSVDVTNHTTGDLRVDFYLDALNQRTQSPVIVTGSVAAGGFVPLGGGTLRGRSSVHFDDFFAALAGANQISPANLTDGILGSVLFVFHGATKSGQGSVTARFRSDLAGGTVGVALRGREISSNEPRSLVAAVRDSVNNPRGEPALYPNIFVNHIGLTAAGAPSSDPVTVELSAISNRTGQNAGTPLTVTIASGMTRVISLQNLGLGGGVEESLLVFARVVAGDGAIHGIVAQVDNITRDGSVFEMSRADF